MHTIILFAHGSRDPLWHKPIQSVAERITQRSPTTVVRCAYLELTEPSLPQVADALVGEADFAVFPLAEPLSGDVAISRAIEPAKG